MARECIPYTPQYAAQILRTMPDDRLARVQPIDFRRWPCAVPLLDRIGRELINAERAARQNRNGATGAVQGVLL